MQDNPETGRPLVVVKSDFDRHTEWQQAFDAHGIDIMAWNQRHGYLDQLRYALVWQPEAGSLAELPSLEVIFSIGAGVDHLKGKDIVPAGIPIVRMVQQSLTAGMVEYVVYQVLGFHRNFPGYAKDQRSRVWQPLPYHLPASRTVGILGLGVLGTAVGHALAQFGFNVIGWSRSEKSVPGIRSCFGETQLKSFLRATDYLVCLLPNTTETAGIINKANLAELPQGAFLVNAGRGSAVVDADLVSALQSGHLAGAALDVFNDEPLLPDSPYWQMDNVVITPHVASMTQPADSAGHVARNIKRHRDGLPLTDLADLQRGY